MKIELSDIFNLGTLIAALVLTLLAVIIYFIVDAAGTRFSMQIVLEGKHQTKINNADV